MDVIGFLGIPIIVGGIVGRRSRMAAADVGKNIGAELQTDQAEAEVPLAMADALHSGNLGTLLPTFGLGDGQET